MASWCMLGGAAAVCLLLCRHFGFRVDPTRAILPGLGAALLYAAMMFGHVRGRPRLHAGATAFLQMTLFAILAVVLSYALAARAGPLWDGALAGADQRLGFDWPAVIAVVDRSPALVWLGGVAYQSLTVQMIVCIVVLSATGRLIALRNAVAAAIASGFVTVAISGLMPAMGSLFDPARHQHLWPSIAWMDRLLVAGLRDGSRRTLDLTQLMGIVSFPSYHATLPIILAWAQRDIPKWRVVVPVWAGLTILATPLFGGHYGVDVLAGIALAVPAIVLAPWLVLWRKPAIRRDARSPAAATPAGAWQPCQVPPLARTDDGLA